MLLQANASEIELFMASMFALIQHESHDKTPIKHLHCCPVYIIDCNDNSSSMVAVLCKDGLQKY